METPFGFRAGTAAQRLASALVLTPDRKLIVTPRITEDGDDRGSYLWGSYPPPRATMEQIEASTVVYARSTR